MPRKAETTLQKNPSSAPSLPTWFTEEFMPTFTSGAAHGFILSGDIYGTTVQGTSQVRFLQKVLAQRCDVIAYYNRAVGITFVDNSMRDQARKWLGGSSVQTQTNPVSNVLAATGVGAQPTDGGDVFGAARNPLVALNLLSQLLRVPDGRGKVAVILDRADTICPQKEKASMSSDDYLLLVTLLSWGQDSELAECDNPVFLLSRVAEEVHADLRYSGSGYKMIDIPLPKREERADYLQWYLQQPQDDQPPITLVDGLTVPELANLTAGLNLRQVEDVLLMAAQKGGVTRDLVKNRKKEIITKEYSRIAEMIEPLPEGFAAVGGMGRLTSWFREELIIPVSKGRMDIPKGILFVGPPGTGKTFLVRALAKELGFNAVALRPENILGGRVGDSERQFREFRSFCEKLFPVLVFLDEVDQSDMARRGNGSGNPVASNLFSAMLQWMGDEMIRGKVVILLASNNPNFIDPALLRLGRMDAIIPVLLPDDSARREMILAQGRGQSVELEIAALDALVAGSTNYSAADLAALVTKSRKLALRQDRRQIALPDAELALRYLRPNTPEIAERYTLLAVQACNDGELLPPPYDTMLTNRSELQSRIDTMENNSGRERVRSARAW